MTFKVVAWELKTRTTNFSQMTDDFLIPEFTVFIKEIS